MKDFWNNRYADIEFAYGTEPNEFLVSVIQHLPAGKVLCLAEGEGRNALYLAKQGYRVSAVDQSGVGLQKVRQLAKMNHVDIETIEADLDDFEIEPAHWEGIVSISAHLPSAIREKIHRQVFEGLKPGSVFILEAYTPKQLEMTSTGGPPAHQREMFMSLTELYAELGGLDFIMARETERHFNEGKYHQGPGAVVQIVARKRQ